MTPPPRGAVPYVYSISKYETRIGQYTAFLNAVAKSDPHGLYHPDLGELEQIWGVATSFRHILKKHLDMKKRQALQTAQRNVRLGKAICVAVAVLLVGGVANFAAFGIIRFEYDFTSETGRVFSQDPIPEGITFWALR